MFKIIPFLILLSTKLFGQDSLCQINRNNIVQILEMGIDQKNAGKRAFELNCQSFTDTLTFYFDKNDCDIKEGQVFYLKNKRIAVYKLNQPRNSLILWQPKIKGDLFYIDFERFCGGEKSTGYLKVSCEKGQFELDDIWFMTSVK